MGETASCCGESFLSLLVQHGQEGQCGTEKSEALMNTFETDTLKTTK
jgi:hypothetical protein